jgi:signal transduction histidine kinase
MPFCPILSRRPAISKSAVRIWGVEKGQDSGSTEVRKRAKELMARFPTLEYDKAKAMARIFGNTPLGSVPVWLEEGLAMWETGRACHDMRIAAEHAASLVRSIKQLGGKGNDRQEISIADSVTEALALVKSDLRRHSVTVELDMPDNLPLILADKSELVQVWVNIIKNGCEAMTSAAVSEPHIRVAARVHRRAVQIDLANNGPRISPELLRRLFLPNITTKRGPAT